MNPAHRDVLAMGGNSNHILGYIAYFQRAIVRENEPRGPLADAPNYYAWLAMASEYTYYSIRRLLFLRSGEEGPQAFEDGYKQLLDGLFALNELKPQDREDILLFAGIRHLLVHKGFPNLHTVPASKLRHLAKDEPFTTERANELRLLVRTPASYLSLATRFARVQSALGKLEGDWKLSF